MDFYFSSIKILPFSQFFHFTFHRVNLGVKVEEILLEILKNKKAIFLFIRGFLFSFIRGNFSSRKILLTIFGLFKSLRNKIVELIANELQRKEIHHFQLNEGLFCTC